MAAIFQIAQAKLRSVIGDEMMHQNFTGDLEAMMEVLEVIQPVLEDAERQSVWNKSVEGWLMRARGAAYDISDMVDELQGMRTPAAGMSPMRRMPSRFAIVPRNSSMAVKVKEVKEELGMILEELHPFNFRRSKIIGVPERTPELKEEMVQGVHEEKERIIRALLSAWDIGEGPVILPIVGVEGLGKTTLARMVFRDSRFKCYSRVWVHMSQEFDLQKIGESIICQVSGLGSSSGSNGGMEYTTKCLHDLFSGRKVLVVLDDLRKEGSNQLERLKRMLGVGGKASQVIVIVTTCSEAIGGKICTIEPHRLNRLSDDMCWTIIKKTSRFGDRSESDKQELEQIGRRASRWACLGVPLAAQLLGGVLFYKDVEGWHQALEMCYFMNCPDDIYGCLNFPDVVYKCLSLSYRIMPSNLRLCCAYCMIFTQGHCIAKDDLIHQWIALGLVESSDTMSTTQLGEKYVQMLLGMSFLQTTNPTSTSGKDDNFTMHNLVRDYLARCIADKLIVLDGGLEVSRQNKHWRYARLSNFDMKLSGKLPAQLRALHCVGCRKMELSDDSFSFTSCLRVFELSKSSMQKLPGSICQLRHLGYLNLSGCCRLVILPQSFGDLLSLLHIDLSGCCGLVYLPESFGKIINLVHVDLSGCSVLLNLPESFGKLINLVHLSLSGCFGLVNLPESFRNLTSLVYLNLSFWSCFEVIPVLGGITNLQHLNLSNPCCYLAPHRSHLEGLKDILGMLTELRYLNLSMCLNPIFYYQSEEENRKYIQLCISGLSKLEHLDLSHNIFLRDLPETLGDLNALHTLDLSGCIKLKRIHRWMAEMDCLMLNNCWDLGSYDFVVCADDGSSNLIQLEDVNCEVLEIRCLENIKSTEEVRRIRLVEKGKLRKLNLCWTVGSHGFVDNALLGELVPPHNLQCLELNGFSGSCFPAWMLSISSHLPNLVEVTLQDIRRCSNLPPLGLLPNLQRVFLRRMAGITRVDTVDLSDGKKATFSCLSKFTIDDMEKLVYLDLSSWSCFVLNPDLGHLTNLQHLNLSQPCCYIGEHRSHCCYLDEHRSHLEGLKDVLSKLTKLQYLNLSMCLNPTFEHQSPEENLKYIELCINGLTCLEHLDLSQNIYLRDLPETLTDLNKLQTLDLSGCIRLKSVPRRIVEMNSLKLIAVSNCRGLESYSFVVRADDSISNLVQLEDVNCENLEISCLEKVKSIEEAQRIRLVEKEKLRKLKLCWTKDCQGSVDGNALLGELVPPHNLQSLELHGYNSETCLPAWRTSSICYHLSNLVEVIMENIPRCSNLPPLGLFPNLRHIVLRRMASITRIDADNLSGGKIAAFNRLSKLIIDDMESLEEFNTTWYNGGEEFTFPAIDELVIQKCPELSFGPVVPRAHRLVISECDKVMASWRKGGHGAEGSSSTSAPVAELVVDRLRMHLIHWILLDHLPGLHSLNIKNSHTETDSPEIIWILSSLHSLCFSHCPINMRSLPEHLGGLTSLRELAIDRSPGIQSLPESICKLTNLEALHIWECPMLEKWCKSEETKQKLSHIPIKYEKFGTAKIGKQPSQIQRSSSVLAD